MTIASDLFVAHRNLVTARMGLQKALGRIMGGAPFDTANAEKVKRALSFSRETSRLVRDAVRLAAGARGQIIPFPRRTG